MRAANERFLLIDVREPYEAERCNIGGTLIPMGEVVDRVAEIPKDYHFVLNRTIRHNLATERITTDYVLAELTPLRRPRRSDPPAP